MHGADARTVLPRGARVEHLLRDAAPEVLRALHVDVGVEIDAVVTGGLGDEVARLPHQRPRQSVTAVPGADVDADELGGGGRRVAFGEPAGVRRMGRVPPTVSAARPCPA
ncbi:hypothetical protein GCM10010236_26130 [Streptomyces eurythermus]|nr:hypothetical protein GCM10010236_26130 [Streptomyces eurythermus]